MTHKPESPGRDMKTMTLREVEEQSKHQQQNLG